VPFQCASVSGQNVTSLRTACREIGNLIVKCYKKHKGKGGGNLKKEVTERIVREYMEAASEGIWGGQKHDIVFKTFYK